MILPQKISASGTSYDTWLWVVDSVCVAFDSVLCVTKFNDLLGSFRLGFVCCLDVAPAMTGQGNCAVGRPSTKCLLHTYECLFTFLIVKSFLLQAFTHSNVSLCLVFGLGIGKNVTSFIYWWSLYRLSLLQVPQAHRLTIMINFHVCILPPRHVGLSRDLPLTHLRKSLTSYIIGRTTINDISVIYVTAHRCAGGLKKKLDLRSGSQRHRHFVGFFNVPVLAPTRDQPFYTVIPTHRPI